MNILLIRLIEGEKKIITLRSSRADLFEGVQLGTLLKRELTIICI